jgi:hypothetical protein
MQNDIELRRVVERVRVELAYTRAALRTFLPSAASVAPMPVETQLIVNSVGAMVSRINDTIKEADDLLTKLG